MVYRFRRWIKQWFAKEPINATVSCLVLCAHACVFLYLFSTPVINKAPHKHILVKTIAPASPPASPPSVTKTVSPKSQALQKPQEQKLEAKTEKKNQPQPQQTPALTKPVAKKEPPPIADKKPSQAPIKKTEPLKKKESAPSPSPSRPAISKDLLQELEQSIAKIEEKREKWKNERASSALNAPEQPKQIDFNAEAKSDYQSMLVHYLQSALNLPDYGEVKVQLTLHSDGSVAKWLVLKTESDKNRKYLELRLPHLKFPSLGSAFSKSDHTFVLTFCNEI